MFEIETLASGVDFEVGFCLLQGFAFGFCELIQNLGAGALTISR